MALVVVLAAGFAVGCSGGEQRSTPTTEPAPEAGNASTTRSCPSGEFPAAGAAGLSDGAVSWLTCSTEEAYRSLVGANADVVLIEESGPDGQVLIALDALDGAERWRLSTGVHEFPPGPFDGQGIVVLSTDDQGDSALVGVDVSSGEERWRIETDEAALGHSATVAAVAGPTGPDGSSVVRGIDRVTGTELWVSRIARDDESAIGVARSPVTEPEVVAVLTGTTVTALDMRTGAVLWVGSQLDPAEAVEGVIVGTPAFSSSVAALDAESGEPLWTAPGESSYGGAVAAGDGVIVVRLLTGGPNLGLVAYELASGNERWRTEWDSQTQPQLVDGTAVVMLWEGDLAVVSTTDGSTTWSTSQPFGSPLMNSVASNGDSVFVAINSLPWSD